jgi:hypothetical protein
MALVGALCAGVHAVNDDRLLGPRLAVHQPSAQAPVQAALHVIERSIDTSVREARIAA